MRRMAEQLGGHHNLRREAFISGELLGISEHTGSSSVPLPATDLSSWTSGTAGAFAGPFPEIHLKVLRIRTDAHLQVSTLCWYITAPVAGQCARLTATASTSKIREETSGPTIPRPRKESIGLLENKMLSAPVRELHTRSGEVPSVSPELAARQRALLARAGGGLTATHVAQRLNVSLQKVEEMRVAGRLLGLRDPDNQEWTYPAAQFEGQQIVPGLPELLAEFAVKSAWTQLYVLISKDPALNGRSPIDALKYGDLDAVREIVSGYGEQGGP